MAISPKIPLPQAALKDFCDRHHIRRISLFGSVLRDDFRPDSDVDVLVEFEPGKTPGFAFIDVQDELSDLLGRKVDLHTTGSLHPRILKRIESEAEMSTGPTDADRVYHILESASEAISLTADKTKDELARDRVLVLALTRLVEILGEAARNIDPALRERYPDIPWKLMVGTKDRLIHGYDRVDIEVLWDIIKLDLPPLVESLRHIVDEPGS